jgi:hypothetical protein
MCNFIYGRLVAWMVYGGLQQNKALREIFLAPVTQRSFQKRSGREKSST